MKILTALTSLLLSCSLASADLTGTWNATATSENGERGYIVTISKEGEKLTGTSVAVNEGTDRTIDRITVEEKNVTIEYDFERDGNNGIIKIVADEKSPGQLDGKWSVEGSDGTVYMSGDWRAVKEIQFSLAGEWDTVGTTESGEEHPSVLTVTDSASAPQGKFVSESGDVTLNSIKVDGKTVDLAFALVFDGNSVPTTIEAEATDENTLKGRWIIKNPEGEVAATGDWSATRKPSFAIAGSWAVVAALPEGAEYTGTLNIYGSGDKLTGISQRADADEINDLKSVKFDGNSLSYHVPVEFDGQSATITVNATAEGTDTLKGKWTLTDPDGTQIATDTLEAKRK